MSEHIADPDRPRDAIYVDFNRVPWFAKMNFVERVAHFDWLISIWEKRLATARREAIREHGDFMGELVLLPEYERLRSVDYRCEIPGCGARARDTHHLHYNNIGFEENGDLLALCHPHHKAQHRGWI